MKKGFLGGMVVIGAMAAFSTTTMANHLWGNYHWPTDGDPVVLQVVDSVTEDWRGEMLASIDEWNESAYINILDPDTPNKDANSKTRRRCSMVEGQLRICNHSYGGTGWLGIATIGIDGDHILEGSVKINDHYSQYWDPLFTHDLLDGSYGQSRKNHVMCQEIGHLFGLGHTSTDGSSQGTCMDYSWADGINTTAKHGTKDSQWPADDHDFTLLKTIYDGISHDDTIIDPPAVEEPCKGRGCNKKGDAGSTPMGVLVHSDRAFEIWVARRPAGGLWIHHVRLVKEDGHHD